MRLIDADKIIYTWTVDADGEEHDGITLQSIIHKMPTVDAVEVVRCKGCKRFDPDTGLIGLGICEIYKGVTAEYGFCHHGERKDDEAE